MAILITVPLIMKEPESREEAIDLWYDTTFKYCCSCHINPPCGFCEGGFSLSLDEYLESLGFEPETEESIEDAYDRAMSII